jgi:hypothetical protein
MLYLAQIIPDYMVGKAFIVKAKDDQKWGYDLA